MMLTSARYFDDEDWAHWVVITGLNSDKVLINDPGTSTDKGRRVFSLREFEEINGYYGNQAIVSVFPLISK